MQKANCLRYVPDGGNPVGNYCAPKSGLLYLRIDDLNSHNDK